MWWLVVAALCTSTVVDCVWCLEWVAYGGRVRAICPIRSALNTQTRASVNAQNVWRSWRIASSKPHITPHETSRATTTTTTRTAVTRRNTNLAHRVQYLRDGTHVQIALLWARHQRRLHDVSQRRRRDFPRDTQQQQQRRSVRPEPM